MLWGVIDNIVQPPAKEQAPPPPAPAKHKK